MLAFTKWILKYRKHIAQCYNDILANNDLTLSDCYFVERKKLWIFGFWFYLNFYFHFEVSSIWFSKPNVFPAFYFEHVFVELARGSYKYYLYMKNCEKDL